MNHRTRAINVFLTAAAALITMLIIAGCSADTTPDADDTSAVADSAAVDSGESQRQAHLARIAAMEQSAPAGLDMCSIANHVSIALDSLQRWPRPLLNGNDSCVLAVMDSLADGFIATRDARYLVTLDSLEAYSDGYVAEYFWSISTTLLSRRPAEFLAYMRGHTNGASPMASHLVSYWQSEVDGSSDSIAVRERLLRQIRDSVPTASLTPELSSYFDTLLRRARLIN